MQTLIEEITASRARFTAFLEKPITDIYQAKAFIAELIDKNLLFHFEDDAAEIVNANGPIFSPAEAAHANQRVTELYSFDWSTVGHECPIGYALELTADEETNEETDKEGFAS